MSYVGHEYPARKWFKEASAKHVVPDKASEAAIAFVNTNAGALFHIADQSIIGRLHSVNKGTMERPASLFPFILEIVIDNRKTNSLLGKLIAYSPYAILPMMDLKCPLAARAILKACGESAEFQLMEQLANATTQAEYDTNTLIWYQNSTAIVNMYLERSVAMATLENSLGRLPQFLNNVKEHIVDEIMKLRESGITPTFCAPELDMLTMSLIYTGESLSGAIEFVSAYSEFLVEC